MRVLVAPDSFSGTLSAIAAAEAIADGWRRQRPADDIICAPMSDGGEGLLAVVEAATPTAKRHTTEVANARGYAIDAAWLELPDGTAVIESAEACGLSALPPTQRNPRLATTYGVGQLVAAAVSAGATKVIVGLGGSATVDGGAGMATALGHRLLREDGNGVKVGGEYLALLERIVPTQPPNGEIIAAADVTAALLGDNGAVAGFARQKGATDEDLPLLEQALTQFADVAERVLDSGPWRDLAGTGAAGGLGFGLAAFAGAQLQPGAALVAELVNLAAAIAEADLVITGEGRLDLWSAAGKVPGHVAETARKHGKPVLAVVGSVADDRGLFDAIAEAVAAEGETPAERVAKAAATLASTR